MHYFSRLPKDSALCRVFVEGLELIAKYGWLGTLNQSSRWHTFSEQHTVTLEQFDALRDVVYPDITYRAVSVAEARDFSETHKLGINKKAPQIKGQSDYCCAAYHIIDNNCMNLMATTKSRTYATEYAKLHGLKRSLLIAMANPRVFMNPSRVVKFYPDAFDSIDSRDLDQMACSSYGPTSFSSSSHQALKPETAVVTGIPGNKELDLRIEISDVYAVKPMNHLRKLALSLGVLCNEFQLMDTVLINSQFKPYSFSIEAIGSEKNPEIMAVAIENGLKHNLLMPGTRPLTVEEAAYAALELSKHFPRLEQPVQLPQIIQDVPQDCVTQHDVTQYLLELHTPYYLKLLEAPPLDIQALYRNMRFQ